MISILLEEQGFIRIYRVNGPLEQMLRENNLTLESARKIRPGLTVYFPDPENPPLEEGEKEVPPTDEEPVMEAPQITVEEALPFYPWSVTLIPSKYSMRTQRIHSTQVTYDMIGLQLSYKHQIQNFIMSGSIGLEGTSQMKAEGPSATEELDIDRYALSAKVAGGYSFGTRSSVGLWFERSRFILSGEGDDEGQLTYLNAYLHPVGVSLNLKLLRMLTLYSEAITFLPTKHSGVEVKGGTGFTLGLQYDFQRYFLGYELKKSTIRTNYDENLNQIHSLKLGINFF